MIQLEELRDLRFRSTPVSPTISVSDEINCCVKSLLTKVRHISPLSSQSLKNFGNQTLQSCVELCLREEPALQLCAGDRASAIGLIIKGYVERNEIAEAEILLQRGRNFFTINPYIFEDVRSCTEFGIAQNIIESRKVGPLLKCEAVSEFRKEYLFAVLSPVYSRGVSSLIQREDLSLESLEQAADVPLFPKDRECLKNRLEALSRIDNADFSSGLKLYANAGPWQACTSIDSFDSIFSDLVQYAITCGAEDSEVLEVLPSFQDKTSSWRVLKSLSEKALEDNRIDEAIKFAEAIPLRHWRPTVLGDIAVALFKKGVDPRGVLRSALRQTQLLKPEDFFGENPFLSSPGILQFDSLIKLANTLCKN